jgi:hypothetical protein
MPAHKTTTTKDNVRKQCAKALKTDTCDMNAQDCTLRNVTVTRFRIARTSCGAQVIVHQLGSLRATPWSRLEDQDLRLAGLKVRLAREWILESAARPEARADLADATLGLLSRARRAELMNGIDARDWRITWSVVTLSDLYFLSDRYLARNKTDLWQSPVTVSLRRELEHKRNSHQDLLGANLPELFDCDHPHVLFLAPYEEYERYMIPEKLVERTAEFKLYLAV